MPVKRRDQDPSLPPTSHYVFYCTDARKARITRDPPLDPPLDNWMGGDRWRVEVPANLVFEIDEDDEGTMVPFFNNGIPLMRADLLDALREAGVDNIDDYPALIRETRTGRQYDDYRIVNIVGAVRAADMAGSDVKASSFDDTPMISAFFRRLQLDEAAADGLLFFRLAEKVSAILIHAKVREHLARRGIKYLRFVHPNDWSG
jgi:hypothetical protein